MNRQTRYQEVMDRVRVDDEMYSRIMSNISAHLNEEIVSEKIKDKAGKRRRAQIIRFVPILAAAAAAIALIMTVPGTTDRTGPKETTESEDTMSDQLASSYGPLEEESLAALREASGVPIEELTDLPMQVEKTIYTLYADGLAEITYEGEGTAITYRMAEGTEDISGDYNTYSEINTVTIGSLEVTMKGDNGTVSLATWTDGAYTYAIAAEPGISQDDMQSMIQ